MATSSPNPPNPSLPPSAPPVLTLSHDEMRARALAFSKRWAGPQREESEAKTFLDEFFAIFGRDRHAIDAVHEYRVERPQRGEGRIDLLWPGKLLVEMKSTGRDLDAAAQQAFDYLPHLDPESAPRWVMVSDFARFFLHDLGEDIHDYLQGLAPARTGKRAPKLAAAFTLDELYDPLTTPAALLKAHQTLDHAVDKSHRPAPFPTDRDRVEYLFIRYEQLTAPLAPVTKPKMRRGQSQ